MVGEQHRVLLIDGELMAGGRRDWAALVVFKARVHHNVGCVGYHLEDLLWLHAFLEIQGLLEVHFALDLVLLHLVVDDVVHHLCALQIQLEATRLTSLGGLDLDGASLVERTGEGVGKVLLGGVDQNGDLLILAYDFVLGLWDHCKAEVLVFG